MGITGGAGVCALIGGVGAMVVGWATRSFATALSGTEAAVASSTVIAVVGACAVVLGASLLAIGWVLLAGAAPARGSARG